MEKFEIESCKKWIEENRFHTVALQLPDEDLDKVQDLIDLLKSSVETENLELYLVGDGCSPCCNDLLNAQYCQAQGLIHFGHSCLATSNDTNQITISIFYVFYQQPLPEDAANFLSTKSDQTQPHSLVFYDPCYRDAIEQFTIALPRFIFSKIHLANSTDPSEFSLYGRSIHLPLPLDPSNYTIVYIASSKASLHNFALYFYAYDFRSFPFSSISSSKLLSKRMYAIECARNGSTYGLLTSSNSLLNLPSIIHTLLDRVKLILHKNHRQYYTFLMNTLSITKLNNFEQAIDTYVLCSSCSESLWLSPEHKQFNIPLVSIADVVQAFESNEEQINYSFDLRQILSTLKTNEENVRTDPDEENQALVLKNPNALLLQQRDSATGSRTWWGLQITENSHVENEEKPIAELKEGRSGIAAGYSNENY